MALTSQKVLTLWLLLCSTLTIMASAILAPALPAMAEQFAGWHNAEFWVKMVIALPGGAIAVSAIALGAFQDRHQTLNVIFLYLTLFGIFGTAGFFFADSLWVILMTRAIMGIAVAGLMVSITTVAARFFEGAAFHRYMGLQAAFGSFGGVLFLFVGGLLADVDWTYPFLFHLVAFPLLTLAWVYRLPGRLGGKSRPAAIRSPQPPQANVSLVTLMGFAGLAFFEILLLYVIPLYFPFYLIDHFSASATSIGAVLAAIFFAIAITSSVYGWIKSALSFWHIHILGIFCIAMGFMLFGLTASLAVIVIGAALLGFGFGLCRPNLVVWLFALTSPSSRGKMMGVMISCWFLGQFASPFLFRFFTGIKATQTVFLFAATMAFCMVLALLSLKYLTFSRFLQHHNSLG